MPVSVEDYLTTSYEPDCDYVDGELVERCAGEFQHSEMMMEACVYLRTRYRASGFIAVPILRIRVAPTRFRVADVCAARLERPMPFDSPYAATDRYRDPFAGRSLRHHAEEDRRLPRLRYPNVWLIDPIERRAFIYTLEGSTESKDLILRANECDIVLPLPEVFAALQ
jgi:Uma2 family endonuclease